MPADLQANVRAQGTLLTKASVRAFPARVLFERIGGSSRVYFFIALHRGRPADYVKRKGNPLAELSLRQTLEPSSRHASARIYSGPVS